MTTDRSQVPSSGPSNRQKIIAVVFIIILIVIIWQIYQLFSGDGSAPAPTPRPAPSGASPQLTSPQQVIPQPANLPPQPTASTTQDAAELRQQQQAEAQYVSGLNQLQFLRLQRDIEETNRAIMAAKLEIITAQKNIVNLLQPPAVSQGTYAANLISTTQATPTTTPSITPTSPTPPPVSQPTPPPVRVTTIQVANYSVVSVSRVQQKWGAVLGFQGSLYNVAVGDVLPPDNSKVVSIDRSGVVLNKEGITRRISLVPII